MKPLLHAWFIVSAFSYGVIATLWYSGATPLDPTLRWIAFELKPTLAVGWLFLAVLMTCTLVYGNSGTLCDFIALQEDTFVIRHSPDTAAARTPFAACALGFFRFCMMLNAGGASFALFRRGAPWPRTGDTLDSVAAGGLYFLHGLTNCLAVCAMGCGAYYSATYLMALVRGAPVLSDVDMTKNLEEGA